MKNFSSVSTNAARFQDISLNPQKLAGMCAKLKCCLNYEVDNYMEAGKRFPAKDIVLQTIDSDFYQFKTDILAGLITYSTDKRMAANLETITAQRAQEIIEMNKRGEKPDSLQPDDIQKESSKPIDLLAGESITRFDRAKKKKKSRNKLNPAKQAAAPQKQPQAQRKPKNRSNENRGNRNENRNNAPQKEKKE